MSNHLKKAVSPYLLQHSENPVDWYPWCDEAFGRAKREDKPIFLSIGYSTCHWCHVMARESFESREVADVLNEKFISIKVDREERPDIDSVYMSVCQALTGSGGWPMSIFMTWDKKPFFAGTYYPPKPRFGMPGFSELARFVADMWSNDRARLLRSADDIVGLLKEDLNTAPAVDEDLTENAARELMEHYDKVNGGFGGAPKFPTPHSLLFLMMYAAHNNVPEPIKAVGKTLVQMRKGGIFDQIGYGFSRYSTDEYFLVPHFEKMLYDNALLITAYSAAYYVTKDPLFLDTAEKTAEYVLREMTSDKGGFFSAQDADSDGEEGKFYTFSLSEVTDVLGEERGKRFAKAFDITKNGNFEGKNIPNLLRSGDLSSDFGEEIRALYDYRKKRLKLHLDDKILLSWNSMTISALSVLYRASGDEKYLNAAVRAQKFLEENLCSKTSLCTSQRNGLRSDVSFLDDYAYYAAALIGLYDSTLNGEYLQKAEGICGEAVRRFADPENGGFYLSERDNAELFMNPKETYDGAIPSGNSVMAYDLVRLYQLTENGEYRSLAEKQLSFLAAGSGINPSGHCMFLTAKMIFDHPPEHIVIALKDGAEQNPLKERPLFFANVVITGESAAYPLLNGRATYYVCKDNSCLPPSNDFLRA